MLTQTPSIGDILETPHPEKYRKYTHHQLPDDTEYIVLGEVVQLYENTYFGKTNVVCKVRMSEQYKEIMYSEIIRRKEIDHEHTTVIARFWDGTYNNWVRIADTNRVANYENSVTM